METGSVTTPFGRRPMTLAMLASQINAADMEPETATDKWKLYRALCDAREQFGVTDRALAVLNALLSFYPETELGAERNLVVFPSNEMLIARSNGMAPATLRRHLSALVSAGLISRKDSPNGKRYARKNGEGDIQDAFGFSLAPLLARSAEIFAVAARVEVERREARILRERLTLCRRDVAKLLETVLEEGIAGDWETMHLRYRDIVGRFPRGKDTATVTDCIDEMTALRTELLKALEEKINSTKLSSRESRNERHIQNSNYILSTESEPAKEKMQEAKQGTIAERTASGGDGHKLITNFALPVVLQACPEIRSYGPDGSVKSWRDLMTAAVTVRTMLGVSPSAYEEACETMGPENAATVIACILERAGNINSAGGYLRNLSSRARRGEFSLGPMVMSLARANGPHARRVAQV